MKQEIDKSKYIIGIDAYDKQETLEEAAENFWLNDNSMTYNDRISYVNGFVQGAKYQQERSYSEEEVYQLLYDLSGQVLNNKVSNPKLLEKWFEQFKKK